MNIIVYGSSKSIARNKLQDILDNLRYGDIQEVRNMKNDLVVILKDGTIYKAIGAGYSARGYRWQFAYIDSSISGSIIENVILPSFYSETSKLADSCIWY